MASKKLRLVKVPLPAEIKRKDYPKAFPRMPILYLELLENKAKIKQELVNREYVPKNKGEDFVVGNNEHSDSENEVENYEKPSERGGERENERGGNERSNERGSNERGNEVRKPMEDFRSPATERSGSSYSSSGEDSEADEVVFSGSDNVSSDDDSGSYGSPSAGSTTSSSSSSSSKSSQKSNGDKRKVASRLKELLGDSDGEDTRENFSQPRTQAGAPTLGDLAKSGKFVQRREMIDVGHVSMSEQEQEDAKRELLFKFELLKKSYRADNIPEFTIHSDYETMLKSYESTLRTLSLDKSVEDYKKYLIGGFMLMEFVCGNWLGFDMQGFTQQQIISMNSYERLLIELGEKSYVPTGSKWPVEVRLLFLVVMNAAFFIISKMILKKTGSNLMGMINNMNGATSGSSTAPAASSGTGNGRFMGIGKRKMRGPSVNIDDIPDINDAETPQEGGDQA